MLSATFHSPSLALLVFNITKVSAQSPSATMSGMLLVLNPGGREGNTKRWFELHKDFVLYSFVTPYDLRALTATPLPGYEVVAGSELKSDPLVAEKDRHRVMKLFIQPNVAQCNLQKVYYFASSTQDETER